MYLQLIFLTNFRFYFSIRLRLRLRLSFGMSRFQSTYIPSVTYNSYSTYPGTLSGLYRQYYKLWWQRNNIGPARLFTKSGYGVINFLFYHRFLRRISQSGDMWKYLGNKKNVQCKVRRYIGNDVKTIVLSMKFWFL